MRKKILVSACLAGEKCKYDGSTNKKIFSKNEDNIVTFCPESEGGLDTPRDPAEIVAGDGYDVLEGNAKVITKTGLNVTHEYVSGAYKALDICRKNNIKTAVLKAKSPSCGSEKIYNGEFKGELNKGMGVTAALLSIHGIKVKNENFKTEET